MTYVRFKNSKYGFQIIEVLLAVAVCSIVIIPMLNLLNSIYISMKRDGDRIVFGLNEKVSNQSSYALNLETKQCLIMNALEDALLIKKVSADDVFDLDLFTHDDLQISTSTVVTGLSFKGWNLVMSLNSSSTTEPDISIFDFSDYRFLQNKNIEKKLELETGPGYVAHVGEGGGVYGANQSSLSQGHYFQLSENSGSNTLRYIFPGANSSNNPISKKILEKGNLVVIGTQKSVLPEIYIFNKQTGEILSSINTDYGINDMYIHENDLIVLGPQDPELQIFDISNPTSPALKTELDFPGGSGNGRSIGVRDGTLVVGRSKGGNEFMIIDSIENRSPLGDVEGTTTNQLTIKSSTKIGSSVDKIIASMHKGALIFTSNEYGELYFVYEEGSKLKQIHLGVDLPGRVSDYVCISDMIFLSIKNENNPLAVLKIKNI